MVGAEGHERAKGHGQHTGARLGGQAQGHRGLLQPIEGGCVIGGDGDRNDPFLGRLLGSFLAVLLAGRLDGGDRSGRRRGGSGQAHGHGVPDDAEGLVGELQVRGDDLPRGRGREKLRLHRRVVADAGLERADAQVLGGEEDGAQGQGAALSERQRLLPLLDGRDRVPVEVGVGRGLKVAELRQGGLQLGDVLAVAHALFKRAPGRGGAVEQVRVIAGDRVHVRSLGEGRARRGQGGHNALEGALEGVGVGVVERSLDGGLPYQVALRDGRRRPVKGLGSFGVRVGARAGGQGQRADREDCERGRGAWGSRTRHLAAPDCWKHLLSTSSGMSLTLMPSPACGSFTS